MAEHRIQHTFTDTDIVFLNKCLGKTLTTIRFDTKQTSCQLTGAKLSCNSMNGGAYFHFQAFSNSREAKEMLALRLEFLPQPWSVFGEYATVKATWDSIRQRDFDAWIKEVSALSTFNISPKMTPITEWRIYGADCQGKRTEDDDGYENDSFEVDLDLLLAFLGEDGQVFSCSFNDFPELSEGIFLGISPDINSFEERMAFGENHYGEKIFTLKRSSSQTHVQ